MYEDTLNRILQALKATLGTRLLSFVLYGSLPTGEYQKGYSNINTLVVVSNITVSDIVAIGKEIKWFLYDQNPPPLIFTQDELNSFKEVFPIEILDMKRRHTVVYGVDPLKDITIDLKNLEFQCEFELKSKLLKLRQSLFVYSSDKKAISLMINSLPGIVAVFKGILRLKGRDVPINKKDVIQDVAKLAAFDPSPFLNVFTAREKKEQLKKKDALRILEMFIEGITKATDFVAAQASASEDRKE